MNKIKIIKKFKTKKGRVVEIIEPTMELLPEILDFANRLAKEDSFLNFDPTKKITLNEERRWLDQTIKNIRNKYSAMFWAVYDKLIVGSVDLRRNISPRMKHVGEIGLMVDMDFRGEGLGQFLLDFILKQCPKMGIRLAILGVFSDNEIAKNLYTKMGFKEWGRLPNGIYRKKKYSDEIKMYREI